MAVLGAVAEVSGLAGPLCTVRATTEWTILEALGSSEVVDARRVRQQIAVVCEVKEAIFRTSAPLLVFASSLAVPAICSCSEGSSSLGPAPPST